MPSTHASRSPANSSHRERSAHQRTAQGSVKVGFSSGRATTVRRGEIVRKLLHISPGLLAFLLPFAPHTKPLSTQALLEITAITTALTGIYIALRHIVARPGESDFYTTTLSYPIAVLATLFAFPAAPELAAVVVVIIAFGDGSAYLGGKSIGGPSLPWNHDKTWAGSLSFVAVAGPLASLAYWLEADAGTSTLAASIIGSGAALFASLAESLPTNLSDNLRVGVTAAITAAMLHFAMFPFAA